jgi:hypothetical protein
MSKHNTRQSTRQRSSTTQAIQATYPWRVTCWRCPVRGGGRGVGWRGRQWPRCRLACGRSTAALGPAAAERLHQTRGPATTAEEERCRHYLSCCRRTADTLAATRMMPHNVANTTCSSPHAPQWTTMKDIAWRQLLEGSLLADSCLCSDPVDLTTPS